MKIANISLFLTLFIVVLFSCEPNQNEIAEKQLKEPNSIEELGELLFFDSILSRENKVSCASCHKPDFAFSDNVKFSFGVDSIKGDRNTPSAMNMSARNFFFHDGRSESLEDQAKGPIENPKEMDIPLSAVVQKLNNHKQYKLFFNKIFKKPANNENVVAAIAAYERTLETNNSPFDNYINGKDTTLFSESAKRGQIIFNVKGKCFDCHFGPDFTNDDFKNIGIFNGKEFNDSGRYVITKNIKEIGSFKVPGLRNVEMTKPYMHNGMFNTLREVIDYYDNPNQIISNSINRDTSMNKPLGLTNQEKDDLEAFLLSLTDARFKKN